MSINANKPFSELVQYVGVLYKIHKFKTGKYKIKNEEKFNGSTPAGIKDIR
jgi:hypothetical protein